MKNLCTQNGHGQLSQEIMYLRAYEADCMSEVGEIEDTGSTPDYPEYLMEEGVTI